MIVDRLKMQYRASAGRSSIRHLRKDFTNDERKCNSFRQFDESIKTTDIQNDLFTQSS